MICGAISKYRRRKIFDNNGGDDDYRDDDRHHDDDDGECIRSGQRIERRSIPVRLNSPRSSPPPSHQCTHHRDDDDDDDVWLADKDITIGHL